MLWENRIKTFLSWANTLASTIPLLQCGLRAPNNTGLPERWAFHLALFLNPHHCILTTFQDLSPTPLQGNTVSWQLKWTLKYCTDSFSIIHSWVHFPSCGWTCKHKFSPALVSSWDLERRCLDTLLRSLRRSGTLYRQKDKKVANFLPTDTGVWLAGGLFLIPGT